MRAFLTVSILALAVSYAAADDRLGVLKYSDDQPDGKQSVGGSGEMIEFTLPTECGKAKGLRIHGSRYGQAQPPKESFLIFFSKGNDPGAIRVTP